MNKNKMNLLSTALGLCLILTSFVHAQTPSRFLTLSPPAGFPIIPVLEGWIGNEDGTKTISYGFVNRNTELDIDIPIGENNYMEPAEFNGMQPTHFPSGRSRGVFTVMLPADQSDVSVWWHIKTGDSEELKIPGRAGAQAYELDFIRPRPQGALQPLAGFGENGPQAAGLTALVEDYPNPVRVGTPAIFTINARDPSVRDSSDPRFAEPLPVSLQWFKHQGAGNVEFSRHESTEVAESRADEDDEEVNIGVDANIVRLAAGFGVAKVYATFSEPGEYLLRTLVENFRAPDSSPSAQCCWTNLYQRVTVTP